MSGVSCFAAVDYTTPPCDAAVWSFGDIGPGPGWNASSPRPVGVNASQFVAGVECFRLVPYPAGDVCADTTLWAPFHINATNCTCVGRFLCRRAERPRARLPPPRSARSPVLR